VLYDLTALLLDQLCGSVQVAHQFPFNQLILLRPLHYLHVLIKSLECGARVITKLSQPGIDFSLQLLVKLVYVTKESLHALLVGDLKKLIYHLHGEDVL
jgi:hypothetical protein